MFPFDPEQHPSHHRRYQISTVVCPNGSLAACTDVAVSIALARAVIEAHA